MDGRLKAFSRDAHCSEDSPYEGGQFKLDIVCTANYPYAAPQAHGALACLCSAP